MTMSPGVEIHMPAKSGLRLYLPVAVWIGLVTVLVFIQRYFVLSSDPLMAWPISDLVAHPDRYSADDLLVQAGASGNFLLYQLLGHFPFLRENFPLRDFLFYSPIYFLTLFAWWFLFVELGVTKVVASVSILVLAFSDSKLSLNWAHVVPAFFISATSIHFLQVFGLLWFMRGRRYVALGLTALTGFFHPASALALAAVYGGIVAVDFFQRRDWRVLAPIGLFALIFAPNALLIAFNSQGALAPSKEYWEIFRAYQPQAYLGDHFRMGYAYTIALAIFLWVYYKREKALLSRKRELFLFVSIAFFGSLVWILNLYFFENLQIVHTFFVMRVFSVIHPLFICLLVAAMAAAFSSATSVDGRLLLIGAALTPVIFHPTVALIVIVCAAAYALGWRYWRILLVSLMATYLGLVAGLHQEMLGNIPRFVVWGVLRGHVGNELVAYELCILALFIGLIVKTEAWSVPQSQSPAPGRRTNALVLIICLLVSLQALRMDLSRLKQFDYSPSAAFNFDPADYWGGRQRDPAYAELLDWARVSPYKIFSIPPYDDRFLSFRFLSAKGVYVFHRDIAQLMYSPEYYVDAVRRLVMLGGDAPELPKAFMSGEVRRGNGAYEQRCPSLVAGPGYDAIVFEAKSIQATACRSLQPVFQNDAFVVFDVP
jgi:hypothetical protein